MVEPCDSAAARLEPEGSASQCWFELGWQVDSVLAPGAEEPLTVGPWGGVVQGNTRVYILTQRGFDVNSLPTTPWTPRPIDGVPQ